MHGERIRFSNDLGGYRVIFVGMEPCMVQCLKCHKFIHDIQPDEPADTRFKVAGLHRMECAQRPFAEN